MRKIIILLVFVLIIGSMSSCSGQKVTKKTPKKTIATKKKTTSSKKTKIISPKKEEAKKANLLPTKAYKTGVIATYYHDKFNGRKTASGAVFNNNKQTAAHRTLPFGTKLKVINRVNGKWIYVTVNDRGPVKTTREIDLTKRAFMDITDNKNKGELVVDIEIVE